MLTVGVLKMKKRISYIVLGILFILITVNFSQAIGYSNELNDKKQKIDPTENDKRYLSAPAWYNKPANYAQLVGWYQALESAYPDYIEVFKANELYGTGTVNGGYDLYYVRITNENLGFHKPEVLFLGGPHGDETVGTIGFYWFTDWLMRMAFTEETHAEFSKDYLQWIIDNREIYIEVSHNPYGFDHGPQRYDGHGWDLNREADYDGPGSPTGGIWASVPGKTLVEFVDNHLVRMGCDIHGGVRMLIYPWADTHGSVTGVSPISGISYVHAPPDFYFYDAHGLRVGSYIGDYGGNLYYGNIGPIRDLLWYSIKGGIANWGYGSDTDKNPSEAPYVQYGPYPGSGIIWLSPEMSDIKNPSESSFGNDTIHRYGAEMRRYVMHQTDLAQPYLMWQGGTIKNDAVVPPDSTVSLNWQVNGSLVVDHTNIQWGTDPDPINNYSQSTTDYNTYEGEYLGGTGWDGAEDGETYGITYYENIYLNEPGDYYFVAKAQVDQVYADVLASSVYGENPYSRLIKERTNDQYYEMIEGTDGTEEIFGQTWWYSPIIHVSVSNNEPEQPRRPSGPKNGVPGTEYTYETKTFDPNGDDVYYQWNWGDGTTSDWEGPYYSGQTIESNHTWDERGNYDIKVKAKDIHDDESIWSEPLSVTMPRNKISTQPFLILLLERIQHIFPILSVILNLK
jgi:hypothetical protein